MFTNNNNYNLQIYMFLIFASAAILFSKPGFAARTTDVKNANFNIYTIKDGDYLGAIAKKNDTSIKTIIKLNNITNPDRLTPGTDLLIPAISQKNKNSEPASKFKSISKKKKVSSIRITIPKGFTLSKIAKAYKISVRKIIKANKIKNPNNIRSGQKLLIPGVAKAIVLLPPPPCYASPIEFYRVRTDETRKISLTFCNGKINHKGVDELSRMSYPVNMKEMPFPLHPKLAAMLQKVANHYPGRRLEIISGQRLSKIKNHESYHTKGQAMDFRVQGISNIQLVKYVKTFKNRGVGYYPNSVFIHMDTREKNATWIDYSRPKEKPIYGKASMTVAQIEAIRARRLEKKNYAKLLNTSSTNKTSTPSNNSEHNNSNNNDIKAAMLKKDIEEQLKKNIKKSRDAINIASSSQTPVKQS